MDSLSQIALGGAIGGLVGGKKYGRKSVLIGMFLGGFPDLDVFIPYGDPISNFTYHRGFSHSLLFCVAIMPLFAWLFGRFRMVEDSYKNIRLNLLIFLVLSTHVILDVFTIYGTQIFWPLPVPPAGFGSIFIIDPLYTLPLLIGLIWYCITKNLKANHIGLIISSIYLIWSLGAQGYVRTIAQEQIDQNQQLLVQPTPFNTLLWRVLIMEEEQYKVGYYSLFDKNKTISFTYFKNDKTLLEPIRDSFAVSRLSWFTKGFYGVRLEGEQVIMSDLRMGLEPDQYVFQFIIAKKEGERLVILPNRSYPNGRDMSRLAKVWDRIWDQEVKL